MFFEKFCLSRLIFQELYIIWLSFAVSNIKDIINKQIIFWKSWFFWVVRRVKGENMAKWQRLRPLHFISQEPYIKWFWFMLHMAKRTISPKICLTPYLTNCNSYDCGFWYPCVKWWYLSYFELFFFIVSKFWFSSFFRVYQQMPHLLHRFAIFPTF